MTLHYKNFEILFSKEIMEPTSSILVSLQIYALSCSTSASDVIQHKCGACKLAKTGSFNPPKKKNGETSSFCFQNICID